MFKLIPPKYPNLFPYNPFRLAHFLMHRRTMRKLSKFGTRRLIMYVTRGPLRDFSEAVSRFRRILSSKISIFSGTVFSFNLANSKSMLTPAYWSRSILSRPNMTMHSYDEFYLGSQMT